VPIVPSTSPPKISQEPAHSYADMSFAVLGRHVLTEQDLLSAWSLTVSNVSTNSSFTVPGSVRSATAWALDYPPAASANHFYVLWKNLSGSTTLQQISAKGVSRNSTTSFSAGWNWELLGSNSRALWIEGYNVSSPTFLLAVDATSMTVFANDSALLPANTFLYSVLQVGSSLYLAGSRTSPAGNDHPYFGILNLTAGTVTSKPTGIHYSTTSTTSISGLFSGLINWQGHIYVAGSYAGRTSTVSGVFGGYLFRYSPMNVAFTNVTSLLPSGGRGAGVQTLQPWGKNIAILDAQFSVSGSTGVLRTFTYVLGAKGHAVTNETNFLSSQYLASGVALPVPWGNPYVTCGSDLKSGLGELIVVRV
jgi:hypothetical protein